MTTSQKRRQLSVPVDASLRAEIERVAAREHRSVAAQVRHIVLQALEQRGSAEQRSAA
jgi:hypothetical protein